MRGYRGRAQPVANLRDAVAHVQGVGFVDAAGLEMLREDSAADEIAAMPVELDGFGYHDEE